MLAKWFELNHFAGIPTVKGAGRHKKPRIFACAKIRDWEEAPYRSPLVYP